MKQDTILRDAASLLGVWLVLMYGLIWLSRLARPGWLTIGVGGLLGAALSLILLRTKSAWRIHVVAAYLLIVVVVTILIIHYYFFAVPAQQVIVLELNDA
ncbi:MAG: hypothetical protein ABIH41_05170 [Nanoarchaeota archaeon]